VTFPIPGVYVFADKVHPYAVGVVVATDADHPLTAKQQALLDFAGQNQLFLNQANWTRYGASQLKPPQHPRRRGGLGRHPVRGRQQPKHPRHRDRRRR
jgi:hypothetical protein